MGNTLSDRKSFTRDTLSERDEMRLIRKARVARVTRALFASTPTTTEGAAMMDVLSLNDDVLSLVLRMLSPLDLVRVSGTCRRMRALLAGGRGEAVWRHVMCREFGVVQPVWKEESVSWASHFRALMGHKRLLPVWEACVNPIENEGRQLTREQRIVYGWMTQCEPTKYNPLYMVLVCGMLGGMSKEFLRETLYLRSSLHDSDMTNFGFHALRYLYQCEKGFPKLFLGGPNVVAPSEFEMAHPSFPIVCVSGIPFLIGGQYFLTGLAEDFGRHLDRYNAVPHEKRVLLSTSDMLALNEQAVAQDIAQTFAAFPEAKPFAEEQAKRFFTSVAVNKQALLQ